MKYFAYFKRKENNKFIYLLQQKMKFKNKKKFFFFDFKNFTNNFTTIISV